MSLRITPIRKPQAGYPLPYIDDVTINGGLNYLALKADPTLKVIINCGPFLPAVPGDRIDLYWKGSDDIERQVGTRTFNLNEITASFPIPVAVALEAQEGPGEIRYTYTDSASTYPSESMLCLIKTRVPGNPYSAPNLPETIYINEAMSAPTVDPVDIDLSNVARGATVTISAWQNMYEGDVVTLNWGGYPLKQPPLTAAQVGKTLVITVSKDDILTAGNSDELPVSYEIRDVVNNWSLNSPATLVNVDTNINLLEKPDCVDVDAGILNYDSLGSDSSLVMVKTPAPIFSVGDMVTLYWKGFNAQGAAIVTHYELPVASVTGRLRFDVPNEDVALFIGGSTTSVSYTVDSTSTGQLETSRSVMFAVIGTQADLPAPTLENGLVAGVFEPASLPAQGARISLPAYPGMGEFDRIFLSWEGEDSNGDPLHGSAGEELESADVGVTFEFLIDKSEFTNLGDGSEVLFSYVVIVTAGGTRDSLVATYSVKNVIVGKLLKPRVLEAPDDDFLDPSEPLFTKAHVQIPDNVLLQVDDRIDMLWDSPLNEGDFPDYMNIRTDGIGITFEVPKARVEKSLGREIEVAYSLTRSGVKLYDSDVLTLFIGSASDRLLPPPFVVEADNEAGTLDPDAVTGAYAHVLIKAADINVEVNDEVLLSWAGSEAGGSFDDSSSISGSEAGQDVTFDVPKKFVDANLDGSLTVEYTVIRALDGQHQGSKPRELTIGSVSTVAPDITLVQDSADISIPEGGETFDTAVTITGTAQAKGQVEIFDGVTTKGKTLANDTGIWTLSLTGLALGSHTLTVKALYGEGQVSAGWKFSIRTEIAPLITSLLDSGGGDIANGGSTTDTSVTVNGTALAFAKVEIFDGLTSKGTTTVKSDGEWTHPVTGLVLGSHSLTVEALYGAGQVSEAWKFSITAEIAPLITSLLDSGGGDIANGGSTTDTSVSVKGTALANANVEIFDGVTSKGTTTVESDGKWTHPVTGLVLGSHSLTAEALYGAGQVSEAWKFSITAEIAPLITSLLGSGGGAIANGGSTTDTSVTVKGTALANANVEISDGVTSKGTTTVKSDGEWTHPVTGLALGSHSLTAKALYGAGQVSKAWTFSITAEIPELTIDETPVSLDGKIYIFEKGRLEARYDSSTSLTRTAQGGVPPYTYSNRGSGEGLLIDPVTGYVRALDNIGGWVVVTDKVGSTKSYYVQVTGVIDVNYLGKGTWSGANQGAHDRGGWLPSVSELREIYSVFGGSQFPYAGKIWSSEKAGLIPPSYHTLNMQTGAEGSALQNVMLDAIWLFFEEYK